MKWKEPNTEGEEAGEGKNLSRRRRRSEKLNILREGNGKNLNIQGEWEGRTWIY